MNDLFLRACRREPVSRTPVWLMRQAGRYLPEYREIRSKVDFRTLFSTPDLAAQVTLQPLDRFELDAAILFADIMTPVASLGIEVDFAPGPVIARPLRTRAQVEALPDPEPAEIAPRTIETIVLLARALENRAPLIGFAGAPLTVAAYLVEGSGSKDFSRLRSFVYSEPVAARLLFERLAVVTARYLRAQVEAGAHAVQLFDSWAGALPAPLYRELVLPAVQLIFSELESSGVPRIYFAQHAAPLGELPGLSGADVLGVDWRTPLSAARELHGPGFAYQGNLDPALLRSAPSRIATEVGRVLEEGGGTGHIFNLGHGMLPDTPLESVQVLLDEVRRQSS